MSERDKLKNKKDEVMASISELEKEAKDELLEEKKDEIIPVLKERIKEIEIAERTLQKLKDEYQDLLEQDIDDFYYE